MNSREYIVIHHSAIPVERNQFDGINAYHKSQGFPVSSRGFYVGYHYLIEKNGIIRQAREDKEIGAHTVSMWPPYWNMNARGIGICMAGDFTKEKVDLEQLRTLRHLVDELQAKYGIPDGKVILHRQAKATACPGVDFVYLMESMTRPDLKQKLQITDEQLRNAKTNAERNRLTRMRKRIVKAIEEGTM